MGVLPIMQLRDINLRFGCCAFLPFGETAALREVNDTHKRLYPKKLIGLSKQCGQPGGSQYVGILTTNDAKAS